MLKVRPFGQLIGWALLMGVIVVSGCATPPGSGSGARENTVYVVQKGDDLGKISQKMTGTKDNVRAIAEHNNIKNINKLQPGQKLTIPAHLNMAGTSSPSGTGSSGSLSSSTSSATITEGLVTGAAAGVAIGIAACGEEKGVECALLGGVLGAILGTAAGIFVDTKQSEYASTEDYYDAQIKEATKLNQALARHNQNLRNSIQADRRQMDSLIAQYQSGRANKSQLTTLRDDINKKRDSNKNNLDDLQKELGKQQDLLAKMEQDKSRKADLLRKQIKKTQDETTALRRSVDEMTNLSAKVGGYL
ncbi:MAG: LysM peptidoglycan-binding domain-containing protein [Candidatus Contendobacter sp.]|nr:LysM peptidoglycan-binding domain-containing protein [Candidatus Contendobacter sp.]MDS4058164.1 LysM peptidoglycan-binding domain-containing protein [Candidatus Contendobacter sp.]